MTRTMRILVGVLACAWALAAPAQTRAWLDRDRIAAGETVTLNIETDQATAGAPDYAPLLADFGVSGNSSSREFEVVNGRSRVRVLFAVALQPRRQGLLPIPALRVGNQRTQPLTLTVSAPTATPAHAGSAVFIESEADAQGPYVQQAVGYTVRLYYATPLISGQLDQDAPDGATLQRVGDDVQYSRDIGGHRYTVVERHYLLIPERSGTLAIPGARFQGRGVGGFFDDLFGDGERALRAVGAPRVLGVRAMPANAPQPWLPLRALTLRYLSTPQSARAGEALAVTVEAVADGATAAQLPELQLPVGDGAQVFADPVQADEHFADGRPQLRVARKFSVVPARAGTLRIGGPRMAWWDARAGVARVAALPDVVVRVAPGAGGFGAPAAPARDAETLVRVPGVQGPVRPWALATVAFALLWLLTLAWALPRRSAAPAAAPVDASSAAAPPKPGRPPSAQLRRTLDAGALDEVAALLCALAPVPVEGVESLDAWLDDPQQRAALHALQRARWADGDAVVARRMLREAFARGPRWRVVQRTSSDAPALPPLYPAR